MVDNAIPLPLPLRRCALLEADSAERETAEAFIRAVFLERYGARVKALPPILFVLYGPDDLILAVAGLRPARREPLFLEVYLDETVETAIARRTGAPVDRAQVMEVGNLATRAPGYATMLIQSLTAFLYHRRVDWVVFTAVGALRNTFRRLGITLFPLCVADRTRLADRGAEWGSYYENAPEVMYGDVAEGYRLLQAAGAGRLDEDLISAATAMGRALA